MAGIDIKKIAEIIVPKKKFNAKGVSYTGTFDPGNTSTALTAPAYTDHRDDIFTDRQTLDSRELLVKLFAHDPDVSATVNAYLTMANTPMKICVYDPEGELDNEGQKAVKQLMNRMTTAYDYSKGFEMKPDMDSISESFRYMLLLRGGIASELVFDEFLFPREIRHVDMAEIEWIEKAPGVYKPEQAAANADNNIKLDIPNFFVKYFRQNPTTVYPSSHFVAAINTIAARQQVVNDLYRIMQKTGYPRLEVTVNEEVLRNAAPEAVLNSTDPAALSTWIADRLVSESNVIANMRPDAAYVHTDSITANILNEGGPGRALNVTEIIGVLNAQNQAALKTMPSIIGRGEKGVNTASVEARLFTMAADDLNKPIASMYSDMFTLALRMLGHEGRVEITFIPAELRPDTELEPMRSVKGSRLRQDLSDGIITDNEYAIAMFNRPKLDSAPDLSGTGFMDKSSTDSTDAGSISPNSDPLGRSVSPDGNKQASSNGVKK